MESVKKRGKRALNTHTKLLFIAALLKVSSAESRYNQYYVMILGAIIKL